jgi:SAM-dependent methyltransferase
MTNKVKPFLKASVLFFSRALRAAQIAKFRAPDGFTSRQKLLEALQGSRSVLEIGPFDQPLLGGNHVKYFDILDQEALRNRARECGRNEDGCPRIDYVSDRGDLSVIDGEKFDSILSSHCIEHQPDLIRHLNQVSEILRPGGKYFVIVPDKRFSFDHYLPLTRVSEVLAAHTESREIHSATSIITHYAETTHNSPIRHWLGFHRPPRAGPPYLERLREAQKMMSAGKKNYVDVHSWFFTPTNFLAIMKTLSQAGLIGLTIERVYGTPFGSNEFFAVLKK